MMLSILIPTYNFDITNLIGAVKKHCFSARIDYEIILLDNCSDEKYIILYKTLSSSGNIRFYQVNEKAGRSKLRNDLAKLASFKWLLFLDCDVIPANEGFISTYIQNKPDNCVHCGGTLYEKQPPKDMTFYLHWYYGTRREVKSAKDRQKHPYRSFLTRNFFLSKDLFEKIQFDEDLFKYGHEDTLFGYQLKCLSIPLVNIENPIVHLGLVRNQEFINKTEEGLNNLKLLSNKMNDSNFSSEVRILKVFSLIKKSGLKPVFSFIFRISKNLLIKNLIGKNPGLRLFDLYKLGFLCNLG